VIFKKIENLRQFLSKNHNERPIYMTSGGFDPLHIGHVRCIRGTSDLATSSDIHPSILKGLVVVVVNADSFLIRKKGYAFMPLQERMEIIDAIKGVDFVVPWETDGDQTVCQALEILRPNFFTKGGDRTDFTNIPEWSVCKKINCEIIANVGHGGKVQSSSNLVSKATDLEAVETIGYAMGYSDGVENDSKK
tara:strand:+ start:480 stop:1055 length:576 start_codon:yes stop_codon:yes gene_type:complete